MSSKKSDNSDVKQSQQLPTSLLNNNNNNHNRREYNNKAVKEYKTQSSNTLQHYLIEKSVNGEDMRQIFSETVFAAVMLADISGFTKLASKLNVEELKRHINNFFSLLLGNIIKKHKGDVVKFCGDAVLIMWSCPLSSSTHIKRLCAIQATQCGLELTQYYGKYDSDSGTKTAVSLRLHCGISVGQLHCMSLGNSERMEFLISGKILNEMGLAESEAKLGEICLSKNAFELVENDFEGQIMPLGNIKILGSRVINKNLRKSSASSTSIGLSTFSLLSLTQNSGSSNSNSFGKNTSIFSLFKLSTIIPKHKKKHRVYVDSVYGGDEEVDISIQLSRGVGNLLNVPIESRDFKVALVRYVHESARKFIVDSTDLLAELRMVATLFIQILNLDEDFNEGKPQRPQQALLEVLDIMKRLGGALRQYVVDDKGCVIICNFGVAGFSSNNDNIRAVSAAMGIRDHLKQCDIICSIGVAQGMAYCGYVGSKYRKEFTVMGSSVNLAARLMSKCLEGQILVDTNIFLGAQDDFYFETLPKIEAKGYTTPVQVYSPISQKTNCTYEDVARRSQLSKVTQLVGRSYELNILSYAVSKALGNYSSSSGMSLSSMYTSNGSGLNSNMSNNITNNNNNIISNNNNNIGMKNKQMSLRATLSQIIEESSTKYSSGEIGISASQSFNMDDRLFSPRTITTTSSNTSLSTNFNNSITNNNSNNNNNQLSLITTPTIVNVNIHNNTNNNNNNNHNHNNHSILNTASHSSSHPDNIYVIVGGPGYGKTALINEVIIRNATLMCPPIRVNCHISSMYEPYEVIRNLLEELMDYASPPPAGSCKKPRRNSSPRHRRNSFGHDLFHSISEDDENYESHSHRSIKSSIGNGNGNSVDDHENIRKQLNEELYQSLVSWIEYNMADTMFEYISNENIWKGSSSVSTHKMDSKDDDTGIHAPHMMPERMASCLRSRSSRKFSAGSIASVGITIASKTKVYNAMEVITLLRICLNTEEMPSSQLLSEFSSNGLEDMISSIVSEVICQLLNSTQSKTLIIEDLQWCDKKSFEGLMLTLSILDPDTFFLGSMRTTETVRGSRKTFNHIPSFEGYQQVNNVEDLHIDCQILELNSFTKGDVRQLIELTLGKSLVNELPNVISDENISRILSRCNNVPGEVTEQVKALELSITRSKYGLIEPTMLKSDNLLLYDSLSKESQMTIKVASVCGITFSLYLLTNTLKKMGYSTLMNQVEKTLTQLEDKSILKRVSIQQLDNNETQPGSLVSVKSRLLRTDTTLNSITSRQSGKFTQLDTKKRIYTFLDKSFRELIYSIMLETQRVTAHGIIGDSLEIEYQESQTHDCQDAEALAFHYSKSYNLIKEIYYTVEAAKLFQINYKILTSYQHFYQLVLLSTQYENLDEIFQYCCTTKNKNTYYEIFVQTSLKKSNFGQIFIPIRYLKRDEFKYSLQSTCDYITTSHLSNFIAEMSILKYKLCEFSMSHNLFLLACHLRKMNGNLSLPPSFYIKKDTSRSLFGMMFFYQANISLMRGNPDESLRLYQQSLSLIPKSEVSNKGQVLSAMSTVQLFINGQSMAEELLDQAEQLNISVQYKESHCYLKLHSAIISFSNGDFIETQRKIGIAATKYTNQKDFSPIRYQVENLLDWSYFAAGDLHLFADRVNNTLTTLTGDDIPLGSLWYLELQSLCEILRGHFTTARQCLVSLGKYQMDHFGFYYQTSLMSFLLVCEKKYISSDDLIRYDSMEKIIYSGRKLLQHIQTCPIGMICLFLISYSALWVLSSTKDNSIDKLKSKSSELSARSNVSYRASESKEIFRLGGGLQSRLEKIAIECLEALYELSSRVKCLGILCDSLKLKYSCYIGKKDLKFTSDYFEDVIYTTEYQQFAFGLLFWHIERIRYHEEFCKNDKELNDHTYSGTTGGIDILLQKYHIPEHHSIINQEKYSRIINNNNNNNSNNSNNSNNNNNNIKGSNESFSYNSNQNVIRDHEIDRVSDTSESPINDNSADHVISFSQPFTKIS